MHFPSFFPALSETIENKIKLKRPPRGGRHKSGARTSTEENRNKMLTLTCGIFCSNHNALETVIKKRKMGGKNTQQGSKNQREINPKQPQGEGWKNKGRDGKLSVTAGEKKKKESTSSTR